MNTQEKNKEIFSITKEVNGQPKQIELCVRRPTPADGRKAQLHYNKTFSEVLNAGGMLRPALENHMRDQGLWNDEKARQQEALVRQITEKEIKLRSGGIKLSEGKKIALEIRGLRAEFRDLLAERNRLDANTVEGQAENARFNALVASCLVYNDTGNPYYQTVEEYVEHGGDEEAFQAASLLGGLLYKLDKDYEANLPENVFLKRFKLANDQLHLVNAAGQKVDEEGRLVDDEGRYIDGKGGYCDRDGKPVDEKGNYIVVEEPFLDDEGKPIVESVPDDAPPADTSKPKKGTKQE